VEAAKVAVDTAETRSTVLDIAVVVAVAVWAVAEAELAAWLACWVYRKACCSGRVESDPMDSAREGPIRPVAISSGVRSGPPDTNRTRTGTFTFTYFRI
jgi:hypothetical protein